jgi:outer membrane protein assembly factor BamB
VLSFQLRANAPADARAVNSTRRNAQSGRMRIILIAVVSCVWVLNAFDPVSAGDWPQVLGPQRNGWAQGESVEPWSGELPILWQYDCGAGYAGVAVSDGNVFLWHRIDDKEILDCLSARDGKRLWRTEFDAFYRGGVDPDTGPRCVPVVHEDFVVVYGAAGDLHAVNRTTGKTVWSRPLREETGADEGYFGAGSTPLIIDDADAGTLVVVEVGGRGGNGLMAGNLRDGQTRWGATDAEAAYASPLAMDHDERRIVIALMRLDLIAISPATGELIAKSPFGKRGPTVNAATPLIDGNQIFMTASYGIGCEKIALEAGQFKSLWSSDVISSQYATPLLYQGFLYAVTGRDDMGSPGLCCVNWESGKQTWAKPNFGTAHLIGVGDRILAQEIDGRIDLLAADPNQFKSLANAKLPTGSYRSLPAISDGILYCRRSQTPREGQIIAIELPGN